VDAIAAAYLVGAGLIGIDHQPLFGPFTENFVLAVESADGVFGAGGENWAVAGGQEKARGKRFRRGRLDLSSERFGVHAQRLPRVLVTVLPLAALDGRRQVGENDHLSWVLMIGSIGVRNLAEAVLACLAERLLLHQGGDALWVGLGAGTPLPFGADFLLTCVCDRIAAYAELLPTLSTEFEIPGNAPWLVITADAELLRLTADRQEFG
jgi:hypothetical protein